MTTSSPKRKRGHSLSLDTKGPVPRILSEDDTGDYDDASPRTKVVRRFDDLRIAHHPTHLRHEADEQQRMDMSCHPELLELSGLATREESAGKTACITTAPDQRTEMWPVVHPSRGSTIADLLVKSSRPKSPPLEGEISDQFWHDSEITGHDPDDPSDDGYGINGIGFRPTAAIAWSRSQRRKQQLVEYKSREASEARQQRSERRKRFISESDEAPSLESSPRKSVRVRFDDG